MTIQFNDNGFALISGEVTVYIADNQGIYSHSEQEFVAEGTGLSAGAYLDAPPVPKANFAIVRSQDGLRWEYVPDYRGQTYYDTATGEAITINELGKIPQNLTALKPLDIPCKWDGRKWVVDEDKQAVFLIAQRNQLINDIDDKATAIYNHWTRFADEYRARKEAAETYKAAGYQGEVSKYITSFAVPAGIDNKTATDLILQQAAGLQRLQDELAAQRMRKYEIKRAETVEQMQVIYDDIIEQMKNLEEAYKNG